VNLNRERTLANIADRALRICEDYRLIWNRHEEAFFVAHKTDRARRYQVTPKTCACPAFEEYGTCKHYLGLHSLASVEDQRYTLLGFPSDRERIREFIAELELAPYAHQLALLDDCEDEVHGCDPYAEIG